MARKRRPDIRIKLAVLAVSVILTLLVSEALIAVTGIAVRCNRIFVPGKGGSRIPHSAYRHTREGYSEGHFNAHGFRDYEHTLEKPPGTFRIAIIGDSYTEGLEVDLDKTFPALLDRRFEEAYPSRDVEVLAFGRAGYGTSDALMCYLNYGVKFSPDLVILAFLTGNDFRNNHPQLSPDDIRFFHRVDEDGRLVVDASRIDGYESRLTTPKKVFQAVRRRSYLLSMASEYLHLRRRQEQHARFEAAGETVPTSSSSQVGIKSMSAHNELNVFLDDPAPVWDEALAITARVLEEFNREVTARGAQLGIVSLSSSRQVHPERQVQIEAIYGARFNYDRPDRFVDETCRALGIPFKKLYPLLLQHHLETGEYVHGFDGSIGGHWNEIGHRVAAEHIFAFLEPFVDGSYVAREPSMPQLGRE